MGPHIIIRRNRFKELQGLIAMLWILKFPLKVPAVEPCAPQGGHMRVDRTCNRWGLVAGCCCVDLQRPRRGLECWVPNL